MGNNLHKQNKGVKEHSILLTGLYFTGKKTILEKLKQGNVVTTVQATGNAGLIEESVSFKNYKMDLFYIGGRCSMRPLLHHYYKDTSAIIFVVDSALANYIADVKYELHSMLKEEFLQDAVVLILANKQDLPEAASVQEVIQMMDLNDVKQEHCNIFGTCATTGEGLYEAFEWLSTTLADKDQPRSLEVEQPDPTGKAIGPAKGPKGYLKKLRASLKSAFLA